MCTSVKRAKPSIAHPRILTILRQEGLWDKNRGPETGAEKPKAGSAEAAGPEGRGGARGADCFWREPGLHPKIQEAMKSIPLVGEVWLERFLLLRCRERAGRGHLGKLARGFCESEKPGVEQAACRAGSGEGCEDLGVFWVFLMAAPATYGGSQTRA